jgi:hypothetical protein
MSRRRAEIRSRKYLDGSRGQQCTLQITGVCTGDVETTVAAHIRDEGTGGGKKADDISIADACWACHRVFDGHGHTPLTELEWLQYALRGFQRTLRNRVERKIVIVPLDPERLSSERPVPARKPKAERKAIPASDRPIPRRKDAWPAKGSRKIASPARGAMRIIGSE